MTFSENIKREFIEQIPGKTCCRRALAYGMLFDANTEADRVFLDLTDVDYAEFYKSVFERQFSKPVTVSTVKKAGREHYRVEFVFASVMLDVECTRRAVFFYRIRREAKFVFYGVERKRFFFR